MQGHNKWVLNIKEINGERALAGKDDFIEEKKEGLAPWDSTAAAADDNVGGGEQQ